MYDANQYLVRDRKGNSLLFEDNEGNLLTSDQLDELSYWEIEEKQLRVFDA
jgi:hypothetical protein